MSENAAKLIDEIVSYIEQKADENKSRLDNCSCQESGDAERNFCEGYDHAMDDVLEEIRRKTSAAQSAEGE